MLISSYDGEGHAPMSPLGYTPLTPTTVTAAWAPAGFFAGVQTIDVINVFKVFLNFYLNVYYIYGANLEARVQASRVSVCTCG